MAMPCICIPILGLHPWQILFSPTGQWRSMALNDTSPSDCGGTCVLGLELVSNGTVWLDKLVLQGTLAE